jgi:hypothetical protein
VRYLPNFGPLLQDAYNAILKRIGGSENLDAHRGDGKRFVVHADESLFDVQSIRVRVREGSLPAPSAACPKSAVAAVADPTITGFHEPEMILGARP